MGNKDKITQSFNRLHHYINEAIESFTGVNFRLDSLMLIQQKMLEILIHYQEIIEKERQIVSQEIVWDHLVIGLFGMTGAGKSTLIETLRLRYSIEKEPWQHGSIVGDGARDFTKDSVQYELSINGKRVTLIDIPGIEGDEKVFESIIKKALRKAHFILYVHPKLQRPDEKIAEGIKKYLADWTRVYSVLNIKAEPSYYKSEKAQNLLLTPEIIEQEKIIQGCFKSLLGDELYQGNITVQALLGLCSSSEFSEHKKLNKKATKLRNYFSNEEAIFKFSNFPVSTI